ncbi:MAG: ABC transporter permease subunit/CPBP intramembrane protease [Phycisphaerae bacterium]
MKRYSRVWTVFRKELIDTLRDRRTLIAMIVVPIVLYPVLMLVLVEALRSEAGRQEQEHYTICVPDEAHKLWLEGVLAREDAAHAEDKRANEAAVDDSDQQADAGASEWRTHLSAEQITIVVIQPSLSLWDQVAAQRCHAAILVDPAPDPDHFADDQNRVVQILYSDTDPLSEVMYGQLTSILSNEVERIVRERVTELAGNDAVLTPLRANSLSTTSPDRQFAKVLAMVVPFLLVTMTVTGAMYPAIDLTAGERERGTLETLAVSPVPSGQIVAGKFGVIVTIAMATTTLNLASMTAVIHFSKLDKLFSASKSESAGEVLEIESKITENAVMMDGTIGGIQRDNIERRKQLETVADKSVGFITTAAPVVLLSMIPFAVLFGGVMLAVCSFARTFKEAQNYMMPVMMAAIVPAMIVSYMPTIRLEGVLQVMPVANIVVLMRELFLGHHDAAAIFICLLSTCLYAAAAVALAVRVYGNEAVLFSDVGTYKTLLLRRYMRPMPHPAAAFALLTVAVIFPLNFYAQSSLVRLDASGTRNLAMLAMIQVLFFALPVLFMAWYMKLDLRRTFSLRIPGPVHTMAALLLAASIVPVSNLLLEIQSTFFSESQAAAELLEKQFVMFENAPLWIILLAFAVAPAICEEILFRGFLMAGLRERLSPIKTILVVGLIFGLFHIYVVKIPIVSLMGMLLTFVCLRSGSIFPAILVHIANNGLAVAASRLAADGQPGLQKWLALPAADATAGVIHFELHTAAYLALFVLGIVLLLAAKRRSD